ncbi:hypothetical protein K501DRAFT_272996 [Backusella circina FSU 941]|nr:hypothetical protein K501DRAFT_272996 [Backusella circina FSU 941]
MVAEDRISSYESLNLPKNEGNYQKTRINRFWSMDKTRFRKKKAVMLPNSQELVVTINLLYNHFQFFASFGRLNYLVNPSYMHLRQMFFEKRKKKRGLQDSQVEKSCTLFFTFNIMHSGLLLSFSCMRYSAFMKQLKRKACFNG